MKQRSEFDKSEPCGCGSAVPYAKCCKRKRVRYVRDGRGRATREVKLNANAISAVEEAENDFTDKFGRKPGYRDRLLTGSYRYSPADYDRMFLEIAVEAGVRPEIIYASKEAGGLILSKENMDIAPPQDVEDWYEAVDAYLLASESGVDLLNPPESQVNKALSAFEIILEKSVIHLGSYADRAPRRVRSSLPAFFQFLLVSRIHQLLKSFADAWNKKMATKLMQYFVLYMNAH